MAPFPLETPRDKQTLAAFIWADQPQRLERLREGIAAFHAAQPAVQLHPVRLPDELPDFLATAVPRHQPVILYNTYMTAYLEGNGRALRQHIAHWASRQTRPILWLQWEPLWDGPDPPEYGWVAWTADLWQDGQHHQWQLAWNHPHGNPIHWLPDFTQFAAFWQKTT